MSNTQDNVVDTALQFLERINQHNVGKLAELMTEDHTFFDSLGACVSGRENVRSGWRNYFRFCPDYWVSHERIFSAADQVAIFGEAGGAIAADGALPPENRWRTPAAWLAIVEKGMVKQWRVYADNKPVYDIMARPALNKGR